MPWSKRCRLNQGNLEFHRMSSPKLTLDDCRNHVANKLFEPTNYIGSEGPNQFIGKIGIELENFLYRKIPRDPMNRVSTIASPVNLFRGPDCLIDVLREITQASGGVANTWLPTNQESNYTPLVDKIEFPEGDRFLFEPGGQVEISTHPCTSITELESHLERMQKILHAVSIQSGIEFAQCGTNPWFDVHEVGNQLPKPRYHALEKYLEAIGPYGKQMMLLTCAQHINFDFGPDEATLVKRYIVATLLAPFVTALFANSPRISGQSTRRKSYRSFLWQQLDVTRTGLLPVHKLMHQMKKDHLVDMYLDFALKAPLIYIKDHNDQVLPKPYTWEYWMKNPIHNKWPEISDFENHLSLLFPEVRPKGYLELRSVDAPPVSWQMVPVCFYAGLLYSETHLDKALDHVLPFSSRINALFEEASYGLASDEIYSMACQLMTLAIEGFSSLPADFKDEHHINQLGAFYEEFTLQRKTFADRKEVGT